MTDDLTIDQLAQRTGTTSRNIRAYQERGLLPPPRLVGRTGHYGEGHVARLHHIAQLLDRGFSLAAIRELFDAWERGYGLAGLLGLEEALDASWRDEAHRVLGRADLLREFDLDDESLAASVRLGLVVPTEDGGYAVPSTRILHAGRELRAAGLPVDALLAEAAVLVTDLDRIAERWVALFLDRVWRPYVDRGMPPDELQRITDALHRLPPLALATIEPLFARAMEARVSAAAAEALAAAPTLTSE
ncbi:MAG TPA: MerR family transcriptional regulator [Mycobacteriales bacterium]|jgi:DNA-binding transcriptional MerR regulator|nr:MerR family transcriptional regulator [Mycobacteriales bacterium]